MQTTLSFMGKMLLVLLVAFAGYSIGSSYSERITSVAKGKGQHSIRRSVTPPAYFSVGSQFVSDGSGN
ncbi:hypothetical protein N1030_04130 [Desulfovibrio mangrovi]|uniref:hypothetical protein n=1 Tax=Desulfovibrio mangrovi TaxID=2976983 RepID=UPI002245F622|nr:hypothetical protein [Desulfovibrio mangrovi]UZP68174.1 hypothetical protein N1030_04130 [Desulfovibrio mangrovi]